jgi:hypothetical protein
MFIKIRFGLLCSALFISYATSALALPPLGLTQVSTSSTLRPNLEVIDGTAYLGVANGVLTVDSLGSQSFVSIAHPTLGTPSSVTRVVKAFDGELYVAANFGVFGSTFRPALFSLDQLIVPVITWEDGEIRGVDANLRGFGIVHSASRFILDGSVETLSSPLGSSASTTNLLWSATPSGYSIGDAVIPNTTASAPVVWTPEGQISFVFSFGLAASVRDRNDGQGINIGADLTSPEVRFGQTGYATISDINGEDLFVSGGGVLVSHDDFVIVHANWPTELYGFYPGIVPGFANRAMPLLDIFPELASIDIDVIHDLASVDGYLYMTLSGSDGTFLFGARDPSVMIPEPATALLMFLGASVTLRRRRR